MITLAFGPRWRILKPQTQPPMSLPLMRRRKLTDEQLKDLRRHYFTLDWHIDRVCKKFGVSRAYVDRTCGGRKKSETTRGRAIESIYG